MRGEVKLESFTEFADEIAAYGDLTDEGATRDLRARIKGLQAVEDSLPYNAHKRVRDDIPVAIYDVIADSRNNAFFTDFRQQHIGRIDAKTGEVLANVITEGTVSSVAAGCWPFCIRCMVLCRTCPKCGGATNAVVVAVLGTVTAGHWRIFSPRSSWVRSTATMISTMPFTFSFERIKASAPYRLRALSFAERVSAANTRLSSMG